MLYVRTNTIHLCVSFVSACPRHRILNIEFPMFIEHLHQISTECALCVCTVYVCICDSIRAEYVILYSILLFSSELPWRKSTEQKIYIRFCSLHFSTFVVLRSNASVQIRGRTKYDR